MNVTCVNVVRSPDPPVWYLRARLAQDQTEHRLKVSDCIPSEDARSASDG